MLAFFLTKPKPFPNNTQVFVPKPNRTSPIVVADQKNQMTHFCNFISNKKATDKECLAVTHYLVTCFRKIKGRDFNLNSGSNLNTLILWYFVALVVYCLTRSLWKDCHQFDPLQLTGHVSLAQVVLIAGLLTWWWAYSIVTWFCSGWRYPHLCLWCHRFAS